MWERLSASQRKLLSWIGLLAAVGIGLMLIQAPQLNRPDMGTSPSQPAPAPADYEISYAAQLEASLAKVLAEAVGVGGVDVFVTLEGSSRLVIAESVTLEDRGGETRQTRNPVILRAGSSAGETPLILEQYAPKILGVLIVAEGAENPHTRYKILKAAQTALQLPAHKIEVLAKSKGKR